MTKKGRAVVASVGGGLSIAVAPGCLIADRRLAADVLGGDPPAELCLIPSPQWVLEDITLETPRDAMEEVKAEIEARRIDIHGDYHHQSLYAGKTGVIAKASGWVGYRDFRVDDAGLWGTKIRWTAMATDLQLNGEMRYFSPVVYFEEKTLRVTSLDSFALTNTPRTNDQPPLTAALAAARFQSRRLAASREGGMKDFLSILINILNMGYWDCYDGEDLNELVTNAEKAAEMAKVVFAGGEQQAAASSEFGATVARDATLLQALIAAGLKLPASAEAQLAAAKIAADVDVVPADQLQIVGLPAETKRPAFVAHLISLVTERVPRSEVVTLQQQLDAARETGEKAKVDAVFRKFADRYNEAEEPELRRIATSGPENLIAIEANLSKRAPVVQKPASRDTAPAAEPKLVVAGSRKVMVAGEMRPATEEGSASNEATLQILASKGWGMDRYAEANDLRKKNEIAAANAAS